MTSLEQPGQPEPDVLHIKITPKLSVDLVHDFEHHRKLLRVNGEGLSPEQLDELFGCVVWTRRRGRQNRFQYIATTRVPISLRLPVDLRSFLGSLERALRSRRTRLED